MENEILAPPIPNGEKTRKRKLLSDPTKMWTLCRACKEPGNLENMVYHKILLKDINGVELYGCYEGIYFCSENCKGLFKL